MDEIKQLVEMIARMPSMALWVLGGYLFYKLAILGSMYGTIRFVAGLLFGWLTTRRVQTVEMRPMLDGLVITGEKDALMAQLQRLRGKGLHISGAHYVHKDSVDWLREAIDAKELKDAEDAKQK